ncbi:preprotein translocase subunit YajC [Mesonia hippocampi]|uniref:Sec translocon accessory complex subunit YajC n=1 Tax=Mesonia hippocampi TaxID=1628250 RepID=A0A840EU53_9FLAO|nr:preprotein translocase subunit YajC [Mesonia hippocampi]MBB4120043.1 preprotein translocase subunit YajC [Mesonia hippocampi]
MEQLMSFLPFVALFGVMYLFMIRPQMQRQKREKKFAEELKVGDKVVTKSGLHGKVFGFSDKLNAIIIETGAGKLTYDRSAISLELSKSLNTPKEKESK